MTKADPMNMTSTPIADGLVTQILGDIDFSKSPLLRTHLMGLVGKTPKRLVVDLTGVNYMDSSGVATLVEALNHQRKKGNRLILCGLQPKVKGIFEIARLDMVFAIAANAEAAAKL
jgi:anti-sigma B factor antagonist